MWFFFNTTSVAVDFLSLDFFSSILFYLGHRHQVSPWSVRLLLTSAFWLSTICTPSFLYWRRRKARMMSGTFSSFFTLCRHHYRLTFVHLFFCLSLLVHFPLSLSYWCLADDQRDEPSWHYSGFVAHILRNHAPRFGHEPGARHLLPFVDPGSLQHHSQRPRRCP